MDSKKFLSFVGFLAAAAFSCWATSSSLFLIMPSFFSSNNIVSHITVWVLVLLFYVLASMALSWVIDALNNDGSLEHPKTMFWGGLATLAVTWIILSLPTNAHTFFYNQSIGEVVLQDCSKTKKYSLQLANRTGVLPEYYKLENDVLKKWKDFSQEALHGTENGRMPPQSGVGARATRCIVDLNALLPKGYDLSYPRITNKADMSEISSILEKKEGELKELLDRIKDEVYRVNKEVAGEAKRDVANIDAMSDTINYLVSANKISDADDVVLQVDGILKKAYTHIRNNDKYVQFDDDDREVYANDQGQLHTQTSKFLNPYEVMRNYLFSGKISLIFFLCIILSIGIDLAGFFFYYKWTHYEN